MKVLGATIIGRFAGLVAALMVPATAAVAAAEHYDCLHVASARDGTYRQLRDETVDLTIDGRLVRSRVRIKAANQDLTFGGCGSVKADGSHFSRWFAIECRNVTGVDGSSSPVEPVLARAYAGISPPIAEGYPVFATLAEIGAKLGLGTPERSFVIFVDRKPQYEFFCYARGTTRRP